MNSILRSIISCRTTDQLEVCRDWLFKIAPANRLTETQVLELDALIDTLIAVKSEPRREPVFEWHKKSVREMAQV